MTDNNTLYQIDEKSNVIQHGKNKRKIGFIVLQEQYEIHQDLLHKIIGAVGLDLEQDVLIIQLENSRGRIVLNELYRKSETKHYFIFGLSQNQLSLQSDLTLHHPKVSENFILHHSFSLDELATDQAKKKILWGYLKKIFK